ncbi:hypothetical protein NOT90_18740 [Rhodococcus rhodochrous]|nr:hypothetical protein [Rhodococcus rhodochrous]
MMPWRPRVPVDVDIPFTVVVDAVAAINVLVDIPIPFGVSYLADAVGGSVHIEAPVTFGYDASAAMVPALSVAVPFENHVDVATTMQLNPVTDARINKSGTQSLSTSNSWHQVTGFAADSGYPGTTLSSHSIVVAGFGTARLSAAVAWSTANGNRQCRIKVNGNVVAVSTSTTGTPSISNIEVELVAGDVVTLEAYTTTSFSAYRTIAVAGTFLQINAVVPLVLRASDDFNRPNGSLGSNWTTTGGGTLNIANNHLNGVGTPSTPLSYAWWHEPMPSNTQVVRAVVRWDGMDPEHSACGVVVRANPSGTPTAPGRQFGVQFSWTRSIMALYFEDYNAPNGFTPVTGVAQYVSTSKFPEGAVVELRAEGNLYTARMNGTIMLQGTVENGVIPFSNRYVGLTIQDDSAVANGGGPPGRLDDFEAWTPEV